MSSTFYTSTVHKRHESSQIELRERVDEVKEEGWDARLSGPDPAT
jgi:hypothetical protein